MTNSSPKISSLTTVSPAELSRYNRDRLHAAAPNLIVNSDALAHSGNIAAAIQGYTTAKQWDSSLRFNPGDRANELAKAAKSKPDR